MKLDPMSIIMFALIAVLIIFMIRNGKKRQQAAQEMQNNLRPGAEVMLASGIYGTVEELDEEANRVTVRSGTSTLVVHRNAVNQIISPAESVDEPAEQVAPDDDPEFGERIAGAKADAENSDAVEETVEATEAPAAEDSANAGDADATDTAEADADGEQGNAKA